MTDMTLDDAAVVDAIAAYNQDASAAFNRFMNLAKIGSVVQLLTNGHININGKDASIRPGEKALCSHDVKDNVLTVRWIVVVSGRSMTHVATYHITNLSIVQLAHTRGLEVVLGEQINVSSFLTDPNAWRATPPTAEEVGPDKTASQTFVVNPKNIHGIKESDLPRRIITHHDGYGLNDIIDIHVDKKDPNAGGASHVYAFEYSADASVHAVGYVQFQHGPRNAETSSPGVTEAVLLAVLLDRIESFQAGPYPCATNDEMLHHLRSALNLSKQRTAERAKRGVLGTNTL